MSSREKSSYIQQPFIVIGKVFKAIRGYYRRKYVDRAPIRVVVFQGHGQPHGRFRISGRVLEGEPLGEPSVDAPLEDNIREMIARMASKEIPFAQVSCESERLGLVESDGEVSSNGLHSFYCDKEGYFTIEGESDALVKRAHRLWYPLPIYLEWPERSQQRVTTFVGRVQISENPRFGVISDIDDTIMYTGATRIRTLLKTTFSDNAKSRRPFTGVVPFYRALHQSRGGHSPNPFFYVSSSPWNLYDFLVSFLDFHHLPQGTLYLRDLAMGRQKGEPNRHEKHKLRAIESVMELHPDMKFILVGDSGQHDPNIYAKVVAQYPERVLAIIIRDVTGGYRHAEVARMARRVEQMYRVPMLIEPDMSFPAYFAAQKGWIDYPEVRAVERAIYRNAAEPLVRVQRKILRKSTRNVLLFGAFCGAALTSFYFLRKHQRK